MNEKLKFWLIKAFEDFMLILNEFKLPEDEIVTSAVCFHSQQFVEKLIKAYLTFKNIPFSKTHNLDYLLELCIRSDPDFSYLDVSSLSNYAVDIRYPDNFYIPSLEEAKECFRIAEKIKEFVLMKIGIKEEEIIKWIKDLKFRDE
jgi:HEPN domain-containing protein